MKSKTKCPQCNEWATFTAHYTVTERRQTPVTFTLSKTGAIVPEINYGKEEYEGAECTGCAERDGRSEDVSFYCDSCGDCVTLEDIIVRK